MGPSMTRRHSQNESSQRAGDAVERVRQRILRHFNTTPQQYDVVFTANATRALKLVGEAFLWTDAVVVHCDVARWPTVREVDWVQPQAELRPLRAETILLTCMSVWAYVSKWEAQADLAEAL